MGNSMAADNANATALSAEGLPSRIVKKQQHMAENNRLAITKA